MDITSIFSKCQSLANSLFSAEGYNSIFEILEKTGEPLSPWLQGRLKRKPSLSFNRLRDLHGRREELRTEFLKIWKDHTGRRIDVFICPVAAHPVAPIDRWNGASYTSSFVLLDFPAGVIPVRPVRKADLSPEKLNSDDLGSWDKRNKELWTDVDKGIYLDSPLCIQVVAPRLQERRLVEAMVVIDEALTTQGVKKTPNSRL
jgi:amidase